MPDLFDSITIRIPGWPERLAAAPGGHHVYVANPGGFRISVIDTQTHLVVETTPLEDPVWNVAVTPDGRRVFATHTDKDKVSVLDTATNALVATIEVGGPTVYDRAVAITPDGRRVYVVALNTVVIDTATNAVVATIPGVGGRGVAVTPDGRHVYVTGSDTVFVIDTTSNTVATTIPIEPEGDQVAVAPDGRHVYVTRRHTRAALDVIDTTAKKVVATILLNGENVEGSFVAVTPDGRHVFLSYTDYSGAGGGRVEVIQTVTNAPVASIRVAKPRGGALVPPYLYVSSFNNNVSAIRIDLLGRHLLIDRSAEFGTPAAAGSPTACVIPGLGVLNIAYRDTSGRLHELWRDTSGRLHELWNDRGATGTTNLTASAGAPMAAGNPFAYVDRNRNTEILLFRDADGTVRSLYWSTGAVGHDDLSGTAGAPRAAGDPVGYYMPATDTHHVIYRTGDGHLHELNWRGLATVGYGGNLTGAISAPTALADPTAFANAAGVNIVVYRSADGRILSLYWADGPTGLDDLSGVAGTPPAAGEPVAYYTAHNDTHQVAYRAGDGHVYELYWSGVAAVAGWDLTSLAGAPAAVDDPSAYYSAGTNTKHVIYRSADGRLHEIWWALGGGTPAHVDLTAFAGAPPAAGRPAAFTVERSKSQHVAYRGTDNHIYEVVWW